MYAYATWGQAWIQAGDFSALRPAHRFMVGGSLAGLEQQRGWHTESKVNWLLKQRGVASKASTSFVLMLRQAMGAVLVRAGDRLVGALRSGVSRETALTAGTLGTAS